MLSNNVSHACIHVIVPKKYIDYMSLHTCIPTTKRAATNPAADYDGTNSNATGSTHFNCCRAKCCSAAESLPMHYGLLCSAAKCLEECVPAKHVVLLVSLLVLGNGLADPAAPHAMLTRESSLLVLLLLLLLQTASRTQQSNTRPGRHGRKRLGLNYI
jgi:hypothetical protein